MIVDNLKKSIIHTAIRGELVPHVISDIYYLGDRKNEYKNSGIRIKKEKSLDELKFKIPDNWKWARLEDISSIYGRIGFRGYTTADLVSKGEGAITLSPGNIIDSKMDYSYCSYISWDKYDESPEIKIHNGDIILVKTGSSYGKNAIVEGLPEKATINPQFVVLKDIICNTNYLYYVLNSDLSKQQYERFVIGTSIPTFSQAKLNSLLIPLPPMEEQKRIVEKIEELFRELEVIKPIEDELNEVKLNFSSRMRKSILTSAVNGYLTKRNGKECKLNIGNVIGCDSIPDNWIRVKAKTILNITTGKKDANYGTNNGKYLFYTCANIPIKSPTYSFEGKNLILPGNGANVGLTIYSEDKFEAYQRTYVVSSKFDENIICLKYIYYYFNAYWNNYNKDKMYGSAIPYIKLGNLENFEINLPPIEEQKRIVKKIEELLPFLNDIDNLVNGDNYV